MYYSVDAYDQISGRWHNWMETNDRQIASNRWHELIERGTVARVRKVEDLTSGVRWID